MLGFEGLYEVSDHGRVRSLFRGRQRIRLTNPGAAGYPRVTLAGNGPTRHANVHRLVVDSFIGPRPDGLMTRHLDGDQTNNHLGNLRFGTASENMQDKIKHGRNHELKKTQCPSGHPYNERNTSHNKAGGRTCRTCARVRVARWRDLQKEKANMIAEELGIKVESVAQAARRDAARKAA